MLRSIGKQSGESVEVRGKTLHSLHCNNYIVKTLKICYVYVCAAQLIKNLELSFSLSNNGAKNTKPGYSPKSSNSTNACEGRSQGGCPWGSETPNPIPLKLLRIKRVRTRHALHIRLIEL